MTTNRFCDMEFDGKNSYDIPNTGIIYCPTDHIRELFIAIAASKGPYVVVSAASRLLPYNTGGISC